MYQSEVSLSCACAGRAQPAKAEERKRRGLGDDGGLVGPVRIAVINPEQTLAVEADKDMGIRIVVNHTDRVAVVVVEVSHAVEQRVDCSRTAFTPVIPL